jgi:hypothetical protein
VADDADDEVESIAVLDFAFLLDDVLLDADEVLDAVVPADATGRTLNKLGPVLRSPYFVMISSLANAMPSSVNEYRNFPFDDCFLLLTS